MYFDQCVNIADKIVKVTGPKIKDFKAYLEHGSEKVPELHQLRSEVVAFSRKFPTVGFLTENKM